MSLVLFGNFTSIATPGLVTKCTVELTDVERRTLQQLSLKHRHRDFRIRATGLLLRARGLKVQDIARELEVSYQTLYDWAHVWREFGVGGLLVGHTGGRPLALPEAMLATAIKAASAESMTLGQIAQRIESVHGEPMPCRVETLAVALKAGRLLVQACPVLAQKKRDERDFAMKASTLSKLQKAGRDRQCRLIYFDEAGFSASPSVQRGWSPRGKHHCVTPNPHCRRSVMGALDFGVNTLIHEATKQSVKRPAVVQFLNRVAQQADQRPTVVVLDNASIHYDIDHETLERWLIEHRMMLFYLPPYDRTKSPWDSPELNMIEILWKQAKYHWRRFVTWTRDTIDSEIDTLLGAYGSTYQIRFR